MSIISTSIPTDPALLNIIWQEQIQEYEKAQCRLTWRTPISYLKFKIAEPNQIRTRAVLHILNKHIVQWKMEHSSDIRQFKTILDNNIYNREIILMVLIECMEKNKTNIEFIRENLPNNMNYMNYMSDFVITLDVTKLKKYSNLSNISITQEYLDCIFENPREMLGILIYNKWGLGVPETPIHSGQKTKTLSLSTPIAQLLIHHIFTNIRIYNLILDDSKSNKYAREYYLDYLLRIGKTPNLLIIIDKFKTIFNTKQDQLIAMVGLSLLLEKDIKEHSDVQKTNINCFNHFFQTTYTIEFNVFKTLRSLDINDMSLILNSTLNGEILNNIEPVELPEL